MKESRFYHITKDGHSKRLTDAKEALSSMDLGGYVWFYYYQPTYEQLAELSEPLGLHPLSIEDCLDENQIPKIDEFKENTFILFNSYSYSENRLIIEEVNLFLGKNFLITSSRHELFEQKQMDEIERVISSKTKNSYNNPAYLMHIILDQIVDQKFIAIRAIEEALENAEDQMIQNPAGFNSIELQFLRRDIMALMKSIFHEREIMIIICRQDNRLIPSTIDIYYKDIYDHLNKYFELSESFREVVTSLNEIHLSMLNNQMAIAAQKTNVKVERLTLITTIFMPLTLLAGIGGMSEWSMMTGPEHWKTSYSLFLLGMVVLGAGNYFLLKWLDRKKLDD
jgi:magnesium transporter